MLLVSPVSPQEVGRLAPPYSHSIARLAGIPPEDREDREGGGEDRVDSSESDEPKVISSLQVISKEH